MDTGMTALHAPVSAEYRRTTDKTGYADGTLTIRYIGELPTEYRFPTEYRAYWADKNGILEDYTAFAPILCSGEETVYTLVSDTLIPIGADRILVYAVREDAVSADAACAMLPEGAGDYDLGKPLYEMQVQSDIHITLDQNPHHRHFAMVLEEIKKLSPDSLGLFINGDTGDTADPGQYENCQELIRNAGEGAPRVYFAIGNHDLGFDETAYEIRLANFLKGTRNTWTDKAYFDLWIGGVHFIFLGGEKRSGHAWLSETQLAWLDEKLAENRDVHRAKYVFLHQGMIDTVAGCFAYQKWHGVTQTEELAAVLGKYPEAILFSGHSHWVLNSPHTMRLRDDRLCTIFNTSSGGYTWDDACNETNKGLVGCEGYYFYGYGDKVVARGRDFLAGKWIASAQFVVEYGKSKE